MAVLGPLLVRIAERVDLIVVDGHGIAHPRKLGIASHVGVVTGKASIGVAKRRLYGKEKIIGGRRVLVDNNNIIAVLLETGRGSHIYVSPGHMISPFTAARLISSMTLRSRKLPEPTRIADRISKDLRNIARNKGIKRVGILDCSFLFNNYNNYKI